MWAFLIIDKQLEPVIIDYYLLSFHTEIAQLKSEQSGCQHTVLTSFRVDYKFLWRNRYIFISFIADIVLYVGMIRVSS